MSKSAPKAPDYAAAAQQQAESSREVTEQQTWANRPTINTPFGQQTWEVTPQWDPSTGQYLNTWTQNTNLTPESQAALDSQMRLQQGRSGLAESLLGRAQQEYGDTMDWSQFDQLAQTPEAGDYGASLPGFENLPNVPNYDVNGLPARGQASAQDIQRGLDTSGLQNVDPSQRYNQDAENAIFGQWNQRMAPEFGRQEDQLRTQLYNAGLKEGDQAYDTEMQKLRQSQNDARTNAQYQATIGAGAEAQRMQGMDLSTRGQQFGERQAGGAFYNDAARQAMEQQMGLAGLSDSQRAAALQEQLGTGAQSFQQQMARAGVGDQRRQQVAQEGSQRFGEQMASAGFQNQRRQQQIAEEMQRRGFSLNEINAILTGQQVGMPSMPGFSTAQRSEGVQALNAAQLTGQANLDAYNAQNQQTQGMLSGIAGGAMMFSDRRLKTDIEPLGFDDNGLRRYRFSYVWEPEKKYVGYMADEVEKLYPDCVIEMHGYKMVNYARVPLWQ